MGLSAQLSKRRTEVVRKNSQHTVRARCRKRVLSILILLLTLSATIFCIIRRRRRTNYIGIVWNSFSGKKGKEKSDRYAINISSLEYRPGGSMRPDLRSMNHTAKARIVSALWTLQKVKGHNGRKKYGPDYRSYDELVAAHADDSRRLGKCAPLHASGTMFFLYHRLLLRQIEASVRVVLKDPHFLFPAWTPSLSDDSLTLPPPRKRLDPHLTTLFGQVPGNKYKGYTVHDGAFSNWPVSRRDGERSEAKHHIERLPNTVIRFPTFCNHTQNYTLATRYLRCTQTHDIDTFLTEAYELHADWHRIIGGAIHCSPDTTLQDTSRLPGDFENARTAVNDPIFFFVHAAFDDLLDSFLWPFLKPPKNNHTHNSDIDHLWRNLRRAVDLCLRQGDLLHHPFHPFFFEYARFVAILSPPHTSPRPQVSSLSPPALLSNNTFQFQQAKASSTVSSSTAATAAMQTSSVKPVMPMHATLPEQQHQQKMKKSIYPSSAAISDPKTHIQSSPHPPHISSDLHQQQPKFSSTLETRVNATSSRISSRRERISF